jgi:hypothetical protein
VEASPDTDLPTSKGTRVDTRVERVDDTTVKLAVTVEPPRVTAALEEAARHLADEVKIPGFRKGKVPRRILETRLGKGAVAQFAHPTLEEHGQVTVLGGARHNGREGLVFQLRGELGRAAHDLDFGRQFHG